MKRMTTYQQLFFVLVVFGGCFAGSYLFFMSWAFHHVLFWYLFCLIIMILVLFQRSSD